jgi:hypothetical protein
LALLTGSRTDDRISTITGFPDAGRFAAFRLPIAPQAH